ncbi:GNAT family N-acetyltransferase [Arthrobacter sp.]|uniref:GNAT family N-acetyltransferase n=1 Tax=Arthrobacter sp. TaxID=1667 RepID=UPI00366D92BE
MGGTSAHPRELRRLRVGAHPRGNPRHCWCPAHRLTGRDVAETGLGDGGEREECLRGLAREEPAPGLIAYRDGEPAGWVGMGPRDTVPRLARSRVIRRVDDVPVWSVFCLVVRSAFRRQGVTGRLLDGAEEYAAAHGAPCLEAYPVEPRDGGG